MQIQARWCLPAAVVAVLLAGCTTYYDDQGAGLMAFQVTLDQAHPQELGSADQPLKYISGTSCSLQACPEGEECLGSCGATGLACKTDAECGTGGYCVKMCARKVYLTVTALDRNGEAMALRSDLFVHLRMRPGTVPPAYRYVKLSKAADPSKPETYRIETYVAQAIGESYVWVEDIGVGVLPGDMQYGQCNNEKDDDDDGFVDLADPDCESAEDSLEAPASGAVGLSPAFQFENPRIWHIEFTDQVSTSPLEGQEVTVDTGRMVVTNVIAGGFFVTDLDDQMDPLPDGSKGYYNSIFFYTQNKPEGVGYGDILCSFSGAVVEHEGNTQLQFPSFDVYWPGYGCEEEGKVVDTTLAVPDPIDLTDLLVPECSKSANYDDDVMANARTLEPFESSLVTLRNVRAGGRFISCDSDEDGWYPNGSDDDACRDLCQADSLCTEIESLFKYRQISAYVDMAGTPRAQPCSESGKKIYVSIDMLNENVPLDVAYAGQPDQSGRCPSLVDAQTGKVLVKNPHKVPIGDTLFTEYTCPTMQVAQVTGSLRQIYLCTNKPGKQESCTLQLLVVVPRFDADFVVVKE